MVNETLDEFLAKHFNERELRLIQNCRVYAHSDPAGLPGHNLMLIVNTMYNIIVSERGLRDE